MKILAYASCLALLAFLILAPQAAVACPFCSAVSMTLGEEMKSSDAAVIATLVERPPAADPANGNPVKAKFKIVKALKGEKLLAGKPTIEMLFFGTQEPGTNFLLFGIDPKELAWGTPTALTDRATEYIETVAQLSDAPADRLVFFQKYFEDEDPLLLGDAFNEFAKAPYADVMLIKDRMPHDKLVEWIKDEKVPASRRRLYLTMLGMCGTPTDVPMIEAMINTDDRQARTALDAMIGCYLNLKGANGLPLVEDLFLKNDKSEYVDTYSAIVALRVLGQETSLIPKDRLVAALEHMLDRPQLADLVIPDLARWQDWKAMDRLVDLFKNANEESSWVRVPVVQFLRACPDPKAQEHLKELAQIDPDAVKRATNFLALPGAAGPVAAAANANPPAASPSAAPGELTKTLEAAANQGAQEGNAAAGDAGSVAPEVAASTVDAEPAPTESLAPVAASAVDDPADQSREAAPATLDRTASGSAATTLGSKSFEIPMVWVAAAVCLVVVAVSVLFFSRRRVTP
jgi:hypothetical protein